MRILLIDGLNLVRRVYAAVPGEEGTDEHFDSALGSMASSLIRAIDRHDPTHAVVVFDGQGESWRKRLFEGYKAARKPMPPRLFQGLEEIRSRFSKLAVPSIEVPEYEADDVLATLALAIASSGRGTVDIISTDKHLAQTIEPGVRVYDHFADRPVDDEWVKGRFGVAPAQLATLFALAGDTGVSVPGITGVGAKTAAKLINDHGDLDAIFAAAGDIKGKLGERLRDGEADARLALTLLSLKTDVPVGVNLKDMRYVPPGAA